MTEPRDAAPTQEQETSRGREIIPGVVPNSTHMRQNVCYWAPIETQVSRYPEAPGTRTVVRPSREVSEGVHRVMQDTVAAKKGVHGEDATAGDGGIGDTSSRNGAPRIDPRLRPPKPPLPSHGYTNWHVLEYPRGSRYEGFVKTIPDPVATGLRIPTEDRHGYGEMTYMDGRSYRGSWFDNQKHGRGTETGIDGTRHVGDWRGDKKHGRGVVHYPHGAIDKGVWKRGKKTKTILGLQMP